jgi:hypothetical protein
VQNVLLFFVKIAVKFPFHSAFQSQDKKDSTVPKNVYFNIILNTFPTQIYVNFVSEFIKKKKFSNVPTVPLCFVNNAVKSLWISAFQSQ